MIHKVVSEATPVIPAGSVRAQVLAFFGPAAAGNDTRTTLATHWISLRRSRWEIGWMPGCA